MSTDWINTSNWINTKEYFVAYSIMINAAQHFGLCTYQEIAQAIGKPTVGSYMGRVVGSLIGQISKNEVDHGRPMLSCIVVGVNGKSGPGLFAWAKELGVQKPYETDDAFLADERKAVYETWKIPYRASTGDEQ